MGNVLFAEFMKSDFFSFGQFCLISPRIRNFLISEFMKSEFFSFDQICLISPRIGNFLFSESIKTEIFHLVGFKIENFLFSFQTQAFRGHLYTLTDDH